MSSKLASEFDFLAQNADFQRILNALSPLTERIYLVGGSVRDSLLGVAPKDFDIEVYGVSVEVFDEVMKRLGANGVGKSFFVYKLAHFDISLGRVESCVGSGHSDFKVAVAKDEKTGASRRDFTINSLMQNIFTGEILDFFGGVGDLKNRVLRVTNEQKFGEDALRVLRGVAFVARFSLEVEAKTLDLMRAMSVENLSKRRIGIEFEKLFKAAQVARGARLLRELGLDLKLFGVRFGEEFLTAFESHTKFVKDERLFLYDAVNFFSLNATALTQNLGLGKFYESVKNHPFTTPQEGQELCESLCFVGLKMPLCEWLGLNDAARLKAAKWLGIYDNPFKSRVNAALIAQNFSGEGIKLELQRQQKSEIQAFVKQKFTQKEKK